MDCCKTCGLLNDSPIPSCPHLDFIAMFSLNDHVHAADVIWQLRTGEAVDVNGRYFAVEGSLPEGDYLPQSDKDDVQQDNVSVMSIDSVNESVRDAIMYASGASISTRPEHEADLDDWEPTEPEWLEAVAKRGDRFGVKYRYLGSSIYDAFVEPFLWNHSCDAGVHKHTGRSFTGDIERVRFDHLLEMSTRIVFSEFMMRTYEGELISCPECGFPMPDTRAGHKCVICSEADEIVACESPYMLNSGRYRIWTSKVRPHALLLARKIYEIEGLSASAEAEIVSVVRPALLPFFRKAVLA